MKSCPDCRSNYTDDSLKFCLQDGSELIAEQVSETEYPTVAFRENSEQFTTNKDADRMRFNLPQTDQAAINQSFETQIAPVQNPDRKSNTLVVALATALGMLLLFSVLGIGSWFYFVKDQSENLSDSDKNSRGKSVANSELNSSDKSITNKISSPRSAPDIKMTPSLDIVDAETTISQNINSWKSSSEAHDLDAHMAFYADKVDYYNKSRVNKSLVRNDRQKAYDKYPLIKITLGNINISVDSTGDILKAVFDKEWFFQNNQKQSTGKVKTQLIFSKIGGQWKITSEKDLQVYFVK